jgi:hypothetical protein
MRCVSPASSVASTTSSVPDCRAAAFMYPASRDQISLYGRQMPDRQPHSLCVRLQPGGVQQSLRCLRIIILQFLPSAVELRQRPEIEAVFQQAQEDPAANDASRGLKIDSR